MTDKSNVDQIFDETFLARWVAGELSSSELKLFEQHPDFQLYQDISGSSDYFEQPIFNKEVVLKSIREKRKIDQNTTRNKARRVFIKWAIGAAAILLGAFLIFSIQRSNTYSTKIAEQRTIELPDQSIVVLNAKSSISFNQKTFLQNRTLTLTGEAYFNITSGAGFEIHTPNGKVHVLGTQFNVRNLNKYFEVSCESGRVQVQGKDNKKYEPLTAGMRIVIPANGETIRSQNLAEIASWRSGRSTFTSVDLATVMVEMKNHYDIYFELNGANLDGTFTGSFPHKDLQKSLEMVFTPMDISFQIKGKRIILD